MPGDEDGMPDGQIVVEKVQPLAPGYPTPAVRCLVGARAAPPEDIGGFPRLRRPARLPGRKSRWQVQAPAQLVRRPG